jgi:catechol 2,3-dioxygenase-like lactoylglutathione lyase family enzyme
LHSIHFLWEDFMIPTYTILYVSDVAKSLAFYSDLFGREPGVNTPGFGMFALENGQVWALWQLDAVIPASNAAPGGAEHAIPVASREALETLTTAWKSAGVPVILEPTEMDFGYCIVGLDPDGHRLRPFVPAPQTVAAQG